MKLPLPCIVCDFEPESVVEPGDPQPNDAVMFDAGSGNFGSSRWDTMGSYGSLMINVCDKCLVERKDRVSRVTSTRPRTEYTWLEWDPEADVY